MGAIKATTSKANQRAIQANQGKLLNQVQEDLQNVAGASPAQLKEIIARMLKNQEMILRLLSDR